MNSSDDNPLPLTLMAAGCVVGILIEKKIEWRLLEPRVPKREFLKKHPDKALLCGFFIPLYLLSLAMVIPSFLLLVFHYLSLANPALFFFLGFLPWVVAGALIGIYEYFFSLAPAPVHKSETLYAYTSKARELGAIRFRVFFISMAVFIITLGLEKALWQK